MTLTVTEITPSTIPEDGGYLAQVKGTFTMGHRYAVYIGDTGSTVDPACYSGTPEQGAVIYPVTPTVMRVYTPVLAPSPAPYHVAVLDLDTSEADLLPDVVTVLKKSFYLSVYGLRKPFPPTWGVGPRRIEQEPPTS